MRVMDSLKNQMPIMRGKSLAAGTALVDGGHSVRVYAISKQSHEVWIPTSSTIPSFDLMSFPSSPSVTAGNEKLEYIDSARGIAILMVILVHTSLSLPKLPPWAKEMASYGQLGVQLFFVISAFTLCLSSERRQEESHATSNYLIRRFFRIAPLYYFGILWYFFYLSLQRSLKKGAFRIADGYTLPNMLANFSLLHGFYPPANNSIVPGGWSIGTEVAFYVCFPLLFLVFGKLSQRSTARFLLLSLLVIGGHYLLERGYLLWSGASLDNNSFLYDNLLNQLPVFLLGILAYFLTRHHGFAGLPLVVNLFFLCIFAWLTGILWHMELSVVQPFMLVPLTAALAFVFLVNLLAQTPRLNPRFLQRIGQVSYSMYILHFLFAWDGMQLINRQLGDNGNQILRLGIYYLLTVALTFFFALITEKLIEQPGIRAGRQLVRRLAKTRPAHTAESVNG